MIQTLSITNAGPIESLSAEFNPTGTTTIRGPSQSGKTTMLSMVCLALWGTDRDGKPFPVECIRDGAKAAEVDVTLKTGSTIGRKLYASRKQDRSLTKNGDRPQAFGAEESMREALASVGDPRNRYVVVPFSWLPLVEGPGGGRGFRDLLASLVEGGAAAIVREMMGDLYRDGDEAVNEKAAVATRRDENRYLAEQQGRTASARENLTRLEGRVGSLVAPPELELEKARGIQQAAEAWRTHDIRRQAWAEGNRQAEESGKRAAEWDARRASLGPEPTVSHAGANIQSDAAQRAGRERYRLEQAEHEAERAHLSAREKLEAALRTEALLEGVPCHGDIPGCQFLALALAARDNLPGQRSQVADLEAAMLLACNEADEARKRDRLLQAGLAEEEALRDAEAEKVRVHKRQVQDLGPRPLVAVSGSAEPQQPTSRRPSVEEVTTATTLLAQAAGVERDKATLGRELAEARRTLEAQEKNLAKQQAETAHAEALVEAVRRAPTVLAERGLALLGDLGPVTIEFDDKGGSRVLVDGREAREPLVSRGRLAYADACLRVGLRRALRRAWLPIWVDNAQDWSGGWSDIPGPVVLCWTGAFEGLEVIRG